MEPQRSASQDAASKERLKSSSDGNTDITDSFDFLSDLQSKYPQSKMSITTNLGNVTLCVKPYKDFDLKLEFSVSLKSAKTVQFIGLTSSSLCKRDVQRLERSVELQLATNSQDQVTQTAMATVYQYLESECACGNKEAGGDVSKGKRKKKIVDKRVTDSGSVCLSNDEVPKCTSKGKKSKRRLKRMMEEADSPSEGSDVCQESALESPYQAESSICIISGDSARPTHFIAIRVTNPSITDQLIQVQQELAVKEPLLEKGLFTREIFHLTLLTLGLDTAEDIEKCVQSFRKLCPLLERNVPQTPIVVEGISQFYNRAVFAKVKLDQDFIDFQNLVKKELEAAGVEIRDLYDQYCPHVTLVKLKRPERKLLGPRNIQPAIYTQFKQTLFGQQKVEGLHLCVMDGTRRQDGFYTTLWEISFSQK